MEEKKTTKKTTKSTTVDNDIQVETSTVENEKSALKTQIDENAVLKAQIEEMKAQIELMAKMMAGNNSSVPIRSDKMITFVNLVNGTLVMKGTRIWKIEGQFQSLSLTEDEAIAIITNSNNLVRSGCVYIADSDFIREHRLTNSYNFILSDEQLKSILTIDYTKCIKMYNNTTDAQKGIIADMIATKCLNGEEIDANIVKQISKLSGRKLDDLEPDEE